MQNRTFTDQLNRQVSIPYPPSRIISLVPSQTELLFYLGLDQEIVGLTKFCIYPEDKFKSVTKIGGTKKLKLNLIRELFQVHRRILPVAKGQTEGHSIDGSRPLGRQPRRLPNARGHHRKRSSAVSV